ncbi:MAG: zinc-ribbon domain-containing protein [Chloroflexota bacterium]|nr:zinc-ribbon domain-containing protein [Chloroflexota bacterium]
MYCSQCGSPIQDGMHFCSGCGAPLQVAGGISQQPPPGQAARASRRPGRGQDPYQDQIKQLKLQIKQLKLNLKQITTKMGNTRSQFYETAAFVPRGFLRHGYKEIEDLRLLGPQQQKQQLQQQVMQLEQQLLGLQQAQMQWKGQQG